MLQIFSRLKVGKLLSFVSLTATVVSLLGGLSTSVSAAKSSAHIDCAKGSFVCTEVLDTEAVFGKDHYVGHDEPSTLFYSDQPGSGNQMRWRLTLPSDPPSTPPNSHASFNFQLHPAFWFGMALCDTQSYPEQINTCKPDSDTNIVDPAVSSQHAGTAFMEMQFYPPGWVTWPAGVSCDPTKWCAALNIDSLSQNSVTGQNNNKACQASVGVEPVNFAFITLNGQAQAPANPVEATNATFTPDPKQDLFMGSGDQLRVTMHDTNHGLHIAINDLTTRQSGSMTASATNSFGQVKFDPQGTTCQNIPYDFHPMFSTSSEQTRVPWSAHSYNIAFADEIGHFDYCHGSQTIQLTGDCPQGNTEGFSKYPEPTDKDDTYCFPAAASSLVRVPGCLASNTGFDGSSYQPVWPDGNTALHPTSILFSSPLTGSAYNKNYNRIALEADLPRIEDEKVCNRKTGAGCTLIPTTDDGTPAAFYPFFSIHKIAFDSKPPLVGIYCTWQLGNHIPGSTDDLGGNNQYGSLLPLIYSGKHGVPFTRFNDFRQVFTYNPCTTIG